MEEAFIPHDTNLVFWLGLLLFREEFGMLLADFGNKVVSLSWLLFLVFVGLGKLHLGG